MHMQQTVFMISWILNIPLFIFGSDREPELTVSEVYKHVIFNNKNVLFCWEHNCIQELLKNIVDIGSNAKGLNNYEFQNPEGTSELPYWHNNNYKSIYHFDEKLNFNVLEESLTTCYKKDNNIITYGKEQKCGSGN